MKNTASERQLLLQRGEYARAEQALIEALASDPRSALLHLEAARLYHALNEPGRAAAHLGQARELVAAGGSAAPAAARLRLTEAEDHLVHGDGASAAECLAPLLRSDADGANLAEALVLAARAEQGLGNGFRAAKHAERALELALPGEPATAIHALDVLAEHYAAQQSHARALEAAERGLELATRLESPEQLAKSEALLAERLRSAQNDPERARRLSAQAAERLGAIVRGLPEAQRPAFREKPWRARCLTELAPEPARLPAAPAASTAASTAGLVSTLSEISGLINSMTSLETLLERVMDIALEIVGAERGLVILFEPDAEKLAVKVARNLEGKAREGIQDFSRNVLREVAAGAEVVSIDASHDAQMSQHRSVALYSIRSLVCFPLRIQDSILGAVYLDNQKQIKVYTPEALDFLRAFTNLAAIAIQNSRLLERLKEENVYLKKVAGDRFKSTNVIGTGPAMDRVFRLAEKAMESDFPVLITGETGTGKEVITKAIHFGSSRKDKPFVAQNCAAIPSELLESEMFGYKRGAFTGADRDKKGLFEIADGGTFFLDEIGELDLTLQAKLLRVLQDGAIRRVGETSERNVAVRIITATNRDLQQAVERQTFRLDLYYRLNVLQIDLPPLRDRREDIPLLAQAFLEKSSKQMGREIKGFTTRAVDQLIRYSWPGNVRELENAVARAVVFAERDVIDIESLPESVRGLTGPGGDWRPAGEAQASSPARDAARSRAAAILESIELGAASFWDAVKTPFLSRDLARDVVREVVRLSLEKSGWKYTRALQTLRLGSADYRRFMNFLAKFDLKVDRPPDHP